MQIVLTILLLALPGVAADVVTTDGDTIKIEGTTWRLGGIDGPEGGQMCRREGQIYDCGEQATEALVAIIGDAVSVCRFKNTALAARSDWRRPKP